MEIGSFRLSEIKEMLNVVFRYEMGDSVYTLYARHKNSYVKQLVNIADGWYVYVGDHTVLYALEHINEFKHFKLMVR